jgi:hypothetical protein
MVELAKADVAIVTGGDNGFNHIFVQPEINGYADLRGKTVVVDAPNTAYALLLYKALKDAGLNKGDYAIKPVGGTTARLEAMTKDKGNAAAAVLNPPFSFRAGEAGLKDMGTATKAIGAYQSDGAFIMRDWAKANSDALVRYISAYVEGRRWALDPANKAEAIALLSERLKLTPQVAALARRRPTPPKVWRRMRSSTWRALRTCSSCAPRSKDSGAASRPRRRNTSTSPITTGRFRACGKQGRLHSRAGMPHAPSLACGNHRHGALLRSSSEVSSPLMAKSL